MLHDASSCDIYEISSLFFMSSQVWRICFCKKNTVHQQYELNVPCLSIPVQIEKRKPDTKQCQNQDNDV